MPIQRGLTTLHKTSAVDEVISAIPIRVFDIVVAASSTSATVTYLYDRAGGNLLFRINCPAGQTVHLRFSHGWPVPGLYADVDSSFRLLALLYLPS